MALWVVFLRVENNVPELFGIENERLNLEQSVKLYSSIHYTFDTDDLTHSVYVTF